MFAIDEIRCVFLSQSPVELLHTMYFCCMSHVLRSSMGDPLVLGPLCDNNRVPRQPDFISFLKAYNRKYLLRLEQERWYVEKYMNTLDLDKLISRATKYRHYDLLDLVLDREMLWCSVTHITIICSKLRDDLVEKYTSKLTSTEQCYEAYAVNCSRRGIELPTANLSSIDISSGVVGNGHWELALKLQLQNNITSVTSCMLRERRFDLLESDGDYLRARDVPDGFYVGRVLKMDVLQYALITKVKHVYALEQLGVGINPPSEYLFQIGCDTRNKELFDYIDNGSCDCMCASNTDFGRALGWSRSTSVVISNFIWLRDNHPDIIEDDVIENMADWVMPSPGCYHPYAIRKMIEFYPHLLRQYAEDIRDAIEGDDMMTEWFKRKMLEV